MCADAAPSTSSTDAATLPPIFLHFCPTAATVGNCTLQRKGRRISYAVSGAPEGRPVLWCVNMCTNRWIALIHHRLAEEKRCRIIVVDRPGVGRTDAAPCDSDASREQVATDDMIAVLDELAIQKVALLASCAGTAFALHFLAAKPDRVDDGPLCIAPPWVHPADCNSTGLLFRFASSLPSFVVRGAVSLGQACFGALSPDTIRMQLAQQFREKDVASLKEDEAEHLAEALPLIMSEGFTQGAGHDAVMCLASISSEACQVQKKCKIVIGDRDELVPVSAAEWLSHRLPFCSLEVVTGATHTDVELLPELFSSVLDYVLSGEVQA